MKIEIPIPPIDPTAMVPAWAKITYTDDMIEWYTVFDNYLIIKRKDDTKNTFQNVQFIITE